MADIAAPNLRPTPARQPHRIRPAHQRPVIRLLELLGFQVPGGADNRYYLSRWVFTKKDTTVACLWWGAMDEDGEGIFTTINLFDEPPGAPRRPIEQEKAEELFAALSRAHDQAQKVTVMIVDRDDYSKASLDDTVSVQRRALDTVDWWVTAVDEQSGEITLRRDGAVLADTWMAPQSKSNTDLPSSLEVTAADLAELDKRTDVTESERLALRQARLGQGAFRAALIERWEGRCPLTECSILAALRASHILPWRDATDAERLDPNNGLLLSASADALFDRGLITFGANGTMLFGKSVDEAEVAKLVKRIRLGTLLPRELDYLKRHREHYFDRRN